MYLLHPYSRPCCCPCQAQARTRRFCACSTAVPQGESSTIRPSLAHTWFCSWLECKATYAPDAGGLLQGGAIKEFREQHDLADAPDPQHRALEERAGLRGGHPGLRWAARPAAACAPHAPRACTASVTAEREASGLHAAASVHAGAPVARARPMQCICSSSSQHKQKSPCL